jgi:hypothetical protein
MGAAFSIDKTKEKTGAVDPSSADFEEDGEEVEDDLLTNELVNNPVTDKIETIRGATGAATV